MKRPDVLEDVAITLAGDDGCCELRDDGRCCMTGRATEVFATIERRCGLSLADFEQMAVDLDASQTRHDEPKK